MQPEYTPSLRILHVIDSGGLYGAERVLLGLATKCASLGDEVTVGTIVSPEDGGDPLGDAAAGCGLDRQQFVMPDGVPLGGLWRILHFAQERQVDVIHSHGYRANIMLGIAPRRGWSCARICTLHGWTATTKFQKLAAYEWLERLIVHRFDRVVAVSERIRRKLSRTVPPSRLTLINNGVDVHVAMQEPAPSPDQGDLSAGQSPPLLLAAGRLSMEKGFDLLVEAVGRLRCEGVRLRVKIAGDGPMRDSLQRQVESASLSGDVQILGFKDNLEALFAEADLFVLPSRSEGLPLVLLEAMARRVPVVATPVGEVPAVLEGSRLGTLVDRSDADALVVALKRALRNHSDTRLVTERARSRVVNYYSLESMSHRYRAEYFRAIPGGFRLAGTLRELIHNE